MLMMFIAKLMVMLCQWEEERGREEVCDFKKEAFVCVNLRSAETAGTSRQLRIGGTNSAHHQGRRQAWSMLRGTSVIVVLNRQERKAGRI